MADPVILGLLEQVGFTVLAQRERLVEEVFPDFATIKTYSERDLKDIVKDFHTRTVADGRIRIPRIKVQRLLGLIRWVQDAYRCDVPPDPADFDDIEIATANRRAEIREAMRDQADTVAKSAEPKKLKGEKDWYEWYDSLKNYLSLLLGSNDVPLVYVLRERIVPILGATYGTYTDEVIACAPLTGDYLAADAQRVHHTVKSYPQGASAAAWNLGISRFHAGRRDSRALQAHLPG